MGGPGQADGAASSDRVELRGLRAMGVHGALAEERARAQPFEVDVDLELDLRPAGRSDRLADTVDYGAVAEAARSVITGPHADLLEHLAERIAATVLVPPVSAVTVTVRKLRPPVPADITSAGVTIHRAR